MSAILLGIGTALPEHGVTQETSAAMSASLCCESADEHRLFRALYRRSKVHARHSVLLQQSNGTHQAPEDASHHVSTASAVETKLEQSFFPPRIDVADMGPGTRERMQRYAAEAVPLAITASRKALDDASLAATEIDHLVLVSCTGFAAPGVDVALIQSLGLSPQVTRSSIGFMGCHGAFNGLRVAAGLTGQSTERPHDRPQHALVCAVELCSLHFAYGWDPQRIVANALFADGAAAIVLKSNRETIAPPNSPRDNNWHLLANGSMLLPDSTDAMTWMITDHGFEMTLSPRVPELIQTHLRDWLCGWLSKYNLTLEQVGSWAVHPGGPRILQSVQQALSIPESAIQHSHDVLAQCGNMSSPTIVFIIDRLRRENAPRPCVALGFGPGLAVEAMLFV